jgi:hypothetical protein
MRSLIGSSIGRMHAHRFVLIVEGLDPGSGSQIDALYERGCHDAIVSTRGDETCVSFSRRDASAAAAIGGAVRDFEGAVMSVRVVRVQPEECLAPGGSTPVRRVAALALSPLSRLLQRRAERFASVMNAAFASRSSVEHVHAEEERSVLRGFIRKELKLMR